MSDCLFCKIASGEIPSTILYQDQDILAFQDIDPKAPFHFLVVPKKHIASVDALTMEDSELLGKIFTQIPKICKENGITNGYRVVTNVGKDGGQTVEHLHFHVLAGRELAWPPG